MGWNRMEWDWIGSDRIGCDGMDGMTNFEILVVGRVVKQMKWKTRGGLMGTASGGQSLRHRYVVAHEFLTSSATSTSRQSTILRS